MVTKSKKPPNSCGINGCNCPPKKKSKRDVNIDCPRCGGFLQYEGNKYICRDCRRVEQDLGKGKV